MNSLPAVILAAGKGTRLGKLSEHQPKPMTEVNGISMIDHLMQSLIQHGFKRVIVVTGYLNAILEETIGQYKGQCEVIAVYNDIYADTNNIYSLWLAKEYLRDGFYLFEADLFFENAIMKGLTESTEEDIILVGKHHPLMNGTVIDMDADGRVLNMYLKRHQNTDFDYSDKYKTVNFYRIGKAFAESFFIPKMDEHIESKDWNSYYELIIHEALEKKHPFFALSTEDKKWWEVDTQEDLAYCEAMFR